jgi:hypothetical protein
MTRFCSLAVVLLLAILAHGEEKAPASKELQSATQKYAGGSVKLAYKFQAGEVFRTKVTHLATVDTKVQGVQQVVKTRTISGKAWKIEKVDAEGNTTFVHMVEWVDLWNSVSDRPEIAFDSRKDKTAPPGYEHVAQSVGQPLASITINPHGQVVTRKDARPQFNPGISDLTVPLPDKAVKVGDMWHVNEEVKLQDEQKRIKLVQVRHQYTLDDVQTGVATIRVATQVLTPINDPKFEAQLVQRMQKGTIKFDIDAGRVISRQMDLDETVLGFSGPDSSMQYVARFIEEQFPDDVARRATPTRK